MNPWASSNRLGEVRIIGSQAESVWSFGEIELITLFDVKRLRGLRR